MEEHPDFIGPYRVLGFIGHGGFGDVYRAHDAKLSQEVAVKLMRGMLATDAKLVERFKREAVAAGKLRRHPLNPNIVLVYAVDEHMGIPYIVMELLGGRDLHLWRGKDPLGPAQLRGVMVPVLRALQFAHDRGIVHRDVTPANIRVLDDGTPKVMDFGIAKLTDSAPTMTDRPKGTLRYMSPEQLRVGAPVDGRTDLYMAGVVLYECVTGRRPFEGSDGAVARQILLAPPPPMSEVHGTPLAWLEPLVLRCLEKRAEERWPSCGALADRLEEELRKLAPDATAAASLDATERLAQDHIPTPALPPPFPPPASVPEPIPEPRGRRRRAAAVQFAKARELLAAGHADEALFLAEAALDAAPDWQELRVWVRELRETRERWWREADADAAATAMDQRQREQALRIARGERLLSERRFADAKSVFQEALGLDPASIEAARGARQAQEGLSKVRRVRLTVGALALVSLLAMVALVLIIVKR